VAGALYAAYALAVRLCMRGVSTLMSFSAISIYSAAAMVALMIPLGEHAGAGVLKLTPMQFALLVVSAVVGIAIGHVTYYMSIERLGVAVSAGVIQLQPFTVAVASAPIFGEVLTPVQWALGGVAVAGTILMLYVQNRVAARAAAEGRALPELEPDADAAAAMAQGGPPAAPRDARPPE
jgi:drug/metabolite transporter (DMT)-like permease